VKSIGDYAFYQCDTLTEIVIPNNVTSIGECAFEGCTFTKVTVGDGITDLAWLDVSALESITLGNGITSIGNNAFTGSRLTEIVISSSVTSIDGYAFYQCSDLKRINYKGTIAQWNAIKKGSGWDKFAQATEVVCSDGKVTL
jgi:hypothetical protein